MLDTLHNPPSAAPLLSVENLGISFGSFQAVEGVSFEIARGVELDREVLDLEQVARARRHGRAADASRRQRCTGSVAIRTQLAKRLRASVVRMIASPGQNASHQATLR